MGKVSRSCPVCKHTEAEPLYENVMTPVGSYDMSYNVGCCRQCGFFFADTLADDQTFSNYYQSVSKYDVADEISRLDQLRIEAAVEICHGNIPYNAMVIDLGCGFGALLSRLKAAGWSNLYGIDPAPNSAERAHQLFGLENIYCGTMAEAHHLLPLNQADLVCITAVLEHLPHLRADMLGLLNELKAGCKILVEVPCLDYFSELNSEPFGEFSLEHIQFFSTTSLKNFFGSLGANLQALKIVDLPAGTSNSVLGVFELTKERITSSELLPESSDAMTCYIRESKRRLDNAVAMVPREPIVIYGAGSHTARLIPYIEKLTGVSVVAVVDNNPNLLNKTIGKWVIQSPSIISSLPDAHILVSSFRYQNEIATSLRDSYPNPLVLLYE